MRALLRHVLVLAVSFIAIPSVVLGQVNTPTAPPPPVGDPHSIFVPLAPCRILNTRTDPAPNPSAGAARHVDIRSTRCGRIIPPYATAFVLRTVNYSPSPGDTAATGLARIENRTTLPAQANGALDFSVPPNAELAVDVFGYYVAPGTPIGPTSASVDSGGNVTASSASAAPRATGHAGALDVVPGSAGVINLTGTVAPYTSSGVLITAPTSPTSWITTKLNSAGDTASGFAIYNSNNLPILQARADGAVQLLNGAFLDGRTDYYGLGSQYYGYVAIPTNIVHDVTLIDPRDSAGGATNRVVFYNAQSDAEYLSPTVTKFRAATDGWDSHMHINFDSQIGFHWPGNQLYHFRAFSSREGKDTFWVRPATDGDYQTNTRADMYVSGLVGIGTIAPTVKLQVEDLNNTEMQVIADDTPGTQHSPTMTVMHKDSNHVQLAKYGFKLDAVDGKFKLLYGTTGAFTSTPLVIDTTGKLTVAGTIQSTSGGIQFPDSSVQTAAYPFNAGTNTADLNRAIAGSSLTSSVTNSSTTGSAVLAAVAGNGTTSSSTAYLRLSTSETTPKDWRVGMTDGTGTFKIRDNSGAGNDRMTISGASITFNGNVTGTTIQATYQDLAEWVPAGESMPSGTVVVLSGDVSNTVTASTRAYDTGVAGVVSPAPGLLLGMEGPSKAKIATTGRVRVRVDASKAPIRRGDLLVTSDRPGMAMKSEPIDLGGVKIHRPGTLIGKALEPLPSGEGEILVLLSLQ